MNTRPLSIRDFALQLTAGTLLAVHFSARMTVLILGLHMRKPKHEPVS